MTILQLSIQGTLYDHVAGRSETALHVHNVTDIWVCAQMSVSAATEPLRQSFIASPVLSGQDVQLVTSWPPTQTVHLID